MIFISFRVSDASGPPAGEESLASFLDPIVIPRRLRHRFESTERGVKTLKLSSSLTQRSLAASGQIPESLQGGNQMILRRPASARSSRTRRRSRLFLQTWLENHRISDSSASGVAALVPPFSPERRRGSRTGGQHQTVVAPREVRRSSESGATRSRSWGRGIS